MRTTILIADDHEIVRKGLRAILERREDFEVVAEAANGRDAVRLTEELHPDVVLMDLSMPQLNGMQAIAQIAKQSPRTEILVLTMHGSEELIREVLDAGARGYLLKSETADQLVPAVEALRHGKPFLASRASEVVLDGFLGDGLTPSVRAPNRQLTPREREIVQLIAEGHSNKEVAATLGISVKTAETHRTNIMRKLGMHSVSELVRYAIRNHIIEP